jgi:hypothetical protein
VVTRADARHRSVGQPEDAIAVQELVDLYRSARRTPAGR